MKMSLFRGVQIGLDLGCGLNFKKKTELRKKIVENGGIISYIVTKNCHIVVTSDPEKCDVSSKCRMAIKYGLPVLRLDYIWDSLDADRLLPYDSYVVGGRSKALDFKSGKISAITHSGKPKKYSAKPAFNPRIVKIWNAGDLNQPQFNEESHEVAKYAVFMGYSSSLKCQCTAILELHTPTLPSGLNHRSEVAMDDSSTENLFVYRVVCQSGCHKDLEAGKPCHTEIRYLTTADQALAVFAMLYEDTDKKGELTRCQHPVRGVGSPKLQKLMAELVDVDNDCSGEVKELVDHVWREAMAEVTSVLGDIKKIKLAQVEKAEAILVKVRDALKASSAEKIVQNLIEDFYSALPHVHEKPIVNDKKRWLTRKQDMCQLIKDMMAVSEMTNYETRAYVEAKYAALRCRITHLTGNQEDDVVNLIKSSLESPTQNLQVLNVFEVWRWTEDLDFRHDLDRKELLFHSSLVENFVGILSRGLLLPKIVVDDFGGKRSDAGMLGSGIYFASAASKSMKYSSPSKIKGSRLLLVNEVALGSCKDFIKHDTTLVAPPEGYNSTHGVSKKWDKSSEFENDEFVVYSVNQQRIRYLVEFTMQEDIVKPLKKTDTVDTNAICEAVENASLQDVTGITDPMSKVKPGLIGTGGKEVELRCVHVRAKLVDLAAQVVVLQEYYNNSEQAIEAKYVFPLDDAAAVCGFEAFINGKHVIGEVKEKEVAHKEYKQAISEGHGAYLMDQDEETPDMFTVSVGNLPAHACVLIKITYVAELQIEDEKISFLLPAAVAPWKEESALKLSTQEKLESYKMSATRTTVQVAVEMPFEIHSLHCPTHKIRIKQTASKAYVEMVDNQKFGGGFQLLVGLAEIHVPRMWVERHSEDKEHQACMLTFYPEFQSSEVADGEIILFLDVSNSMKGTSLLEAKKVALLVLQNLPLGWSFNVARFGSDYEEIFPAPKKSTEENLQLAIQFVQSSVANKGNTDIMRSLRPLFLLPHAEKQRNVFLISDGHVNDSELVVQCAKQNSRQTRLFSFGVSDTCNNYTLKAVSRVSGGAFEHFNSKTKSKWEPKIKSQISKACQPGLTSVNVEWHQYNDNHPAPVQAPQEITALFSGSHQVVYGFVPDCTMATLTAEVDGQTVSTVVSTSELSITEGLLVHRLTAKAVIRDWNDGILSRDRTKHEVAKMDLKNYIIDLSKEYSVVTQFTSFIAVEKREENEKDLPKEGPRIEELVAQENVDFLNYMGWTQVPEDDSLAILSLFEELSQEVKDQTISNKMVCQLNSLEEKYKMLQQQMGPCAADVLKSARVLSEAYNLTKDTDKAANLAETAYKEALSNIWSEMEKSDYVKLADILVDLKEKVLAVKGQEDAQMAPIPFPYFMGDAKIFIVTPAGSELTIGCASLLTVRQLKERIQELNLTSVDKQKLIFHGKLLEDFVSLRDLNVGYRDKIRLEILMPEQEQSEEITDHLEEFEKLHYKKKKKKACYACNLADEQEVSLPGFASHKIGRRSYFQSAKVKPRNHKTAEALTEAPPTALFSKEFELMSEEECVPAPTARFVPTFSYDMPTFAPSSINFAGYMPCEDLVALSPDIPVLRSRPAFGLGARASIISETPQTKGLTLDMLSVSSTEKYDTAAMPSDNFAVKKAASFGMPALSKKSIKSTKYSSPKVISERFAVAPPSSFGAQSPPSDFGAPPSSFGTPPTPLGFGAPTPPSGFGATTLPSDFGTPTPLGFGAATLSGFGAPTPPSGFGATSSSSFGAPTPPSSFEAPTPPPIPHFGALQGFGAIPGLRTPTDFGEAAPPPIPHFRALPSFRAPPLPPQFGVAPPPPLPPQFGVAPSPPLPPQFGVAPLPPQFGVAPSPLPPPFRVSASQPYFGAPPTPLPPKGFRGQAPLNFDAKHLSGFAPLVSGFGSATSSQFLGKPEASFTLGKGSSETDFEAPIEASISVGRPPPSRFYTVHISSDFGAPGSLDIEAPGSFTLGKPSEASFTLGKGSSETDFEAPIEASISVGTPPPSRFYTAHTASDFGAPGSFTLGKTLASASLRAPPELLTRSDQMQICFDQASTPSKAVTNRKSRPRLAKLEAQITSRDASLSSTPPETPAQSTIFGASSGLATLASLAPSATSDALPPSTTLRSASLGSYQRIAPVTKNDITFLSPMFKKSVTSSSVLDDELAQISECFRDQKLNLQRIEPLDSFPHAPPVDSDSLRAPPVDSDSLRAPPVDSDSLRAPPVDSDSLRAPPVDSDSLRAPPVPMKSGRGRRDSSKLVAKSYSKEAAWDLSQEIARESKSTQENSRRNNTGLYVEHNITESVLHCFSQTVNLSEERMKTRFHRRPKRHDHSNYNIENESRERQGVKSDYSSSDRAHSQLSEPERVGSTPTTSGITCVRARKVQLTLEVLESLLQCQTEQGSWKLGGHMDELLGVNSFECRGILKANGLHSLGRTATEHIKDLIATILVLFSITEVLKPGFLPTEVSAAKLAEIVGQLKEGFDDETWRKFNLPHEKVHKLKEGVKKAYMFCCKTERMHPCIYSILELGSNWMNVATTFLQPCAA